MNFRQRLTLGAILGLMILLVGCGVTLYTPTDINVNKRTTATLEELTQGRVLYRERCSSCHGLYAPDRFDSTEWTKQLNKMQKRAKITDEQKELIYKYLVNY